MFIQARDRTFTDEGSRASQPFRADAPSQTDEGERRWVNNGAAGQRDAESKNRQQNGERRADNRRQGHGVTIGVQAEIAGVTLRVAHG